MSGASIDQCGDITYVQQMARLRNARRQGPQGLGIGERPGTLPQTLPGASPRRGATRPIAHDGQVGHHHLTATGPHTDETKDSSIM